MVISNLDFSNEQGLTMFNAVALIINTFHCKGISQFLGKYAMIKALLQEKKKSGAHDMNEWASHRFVIFPSQPDKILEEMTRS